MIIASDSDITLEVIENRIMLHNNKDGLSIMQYDELSIELTKEQIKTLIDAFTVGTKESE
jgi:hypothetical protein